MDGQLDAKECIKYILRVRAGEPECVPKGLLEDISSALLPLERIVEEMEASMQAIGRLSQMEAHSVRSHLDHLLKKGVKFSDTRFDNLFIDRNVPVAGSRSAPCTTKRTAKMLDYSYRERLFGFIPRSGKFGWEEDRIQAFIESIRHR